MEQQPIDTIYKTYDKTLYKTGASGDDPVSDMLQSDPGANQSSAVSVPADSIDSGINPSTTVATGSQMAGKESFTDGTNGYFLGIVNGIGVLNIGNNSSYIKWDGTTLTIVGGISVSSLNIPDTTTANSFHVDTSGNAWWGTNVATGYATAPAKILATGAATFTNITATGGTIGGFTLGSTTMTATNLLLDAGSQKISLGSGNNIVILDAADTTYRLAIGNTTYGSAPFRVTKAGAVTASNIAITGGSVATLTLDKGLMAWTTNIVFTSASATQVNWSSGTIKTQDTTTYTISSGNTGTMAASTYIYLDVNVSTTVLQTTTTYSTATGDGKILIATAQNNTVAASVVPFGGGQPVLDGTANISALSITAASIAASTITAGKLSVSTLSAITANLGTITAGSININSGQATIDSSGNATFKSIQVGGSNRQYTIQDSGIFTYGDGSDSSATLDGTNTFSWASKASSVYTLTRDVYLISLTIDSGVTLKPAGYRIFVQDTLTLNGTIQRNGNNGSAGQAADGTNTGKLGGAGGAALADGYLKGSAAGGGGGNTFNGGASGASTTNSIGVAGQAGDGGGPGGFQGNNPGGVAGSLTASNVKLIANWHLATLLDITSTGSTIKFDNSSGSGGGGAGGTDSNGEAGPGGGGGASAGAIVAIYARIIVIGASGIISANGGVGGNGGAGDALTRTGGGGGGGAGGNIVIVYNSLTNGGTIQALGGAKGNSGSSANSGNIYQFQVSL